FVRVTAVFFFVRKNGGEAGVNGGKFFDGRAHFHKRPYGSEAGARFDAGIGGRHAKAVPLFFCGIFGGQEENLARPIPGVVAVFCGGQENKPGAFLVVAGEVIKVIILGENISLREFFAAGEAPKNDRAIDLGGELGAAIGVNTVGLAFAALLCLRGRRDGTRQRKNDQYLSNGNTNIQPPREPRETIHSSPRKHYFALHPQGMRVAAISTQPRNCIRKKARQERGSG